MQGVRTLQELLGEMPKVVSSLQHDPGAGAVDVSALVVGDADEETCEAEALQQWFQRHILVLVKVTTCPTNGPLLVNLLQGDGTDYATMPGTASYAIPAGTAADSIHAVEFEVLAPAYKIQFENQSVVPADDATIAWARVIEASRPTS